MNKRPKTRIRVISLGLTELLKVYSLKCSAIQINSNQSTDPLGYLPF